MRKRFDKQVFSLEDGEKHQVMSQGSASGTRLERPELCSPSNNIAKVHLYN